MLLHTHPIGSYSHAITIPLQAKSVLDAETWKYFHRFYIKKSHFMYFHQWSGIEVHHSKHNYLECCQATGRIETHIELPKCLSTSVDNKTEQIKGFLDRTTVRNTNKEIRMGGSLASDRKSQLRSP